MTSCISFREQITELITVIVAKDALHAKWLNTLSYLENSGARKIAACEHPTLVKEEMLKHAAEEFRHAHHLKRQINRVSKDPMDTYSLDLMLGSTASLNYIKALDVKTSRYLRKCNFSKKASYILVTYAIELRAQELYPIYDEILRKKRSPVAVKSIVLEEKEHLNEMKKALHQIPLGFVHAESVLAIEENLCKKWLLAIKKSIRNHQFGAHQ